MIAAEQKLVDHKSQILGKIEEAEGTRLLSIGLKELYSSIHAVQGLRSSRRYRMVSACCDSGLYVVLLSVNVLSGSW